MIIFLCQEVFNNILFPLNFYFFQTLTFLIFKAYWETAFFLKLFFLVIFNNGKFAGVLGVYCLCGIVMYNVQFGSKRSMIQDHILYKWLFSRGINFRYIRE